MPNLWPDELIAIARPLYESGLYSASQVAHMIGHGKSKGAVIGKAHRQGWHNPNPQKGGTRLGDKKSPPTVPRPRLWRGYVSTPTVEQPPEPEPTADFLGLTIWAIGPDQCRFPHGDGPEYLFCGQPVAVGSYCRFHHWLSHDRSNQQRGQFTGRQGF